jgi:hypothetical protein
MAKPEVTMPLVERIVRASVASCSCGTKSHLIEWHDEMCNYRILMECYDALHESNSPVFQQE